MVDTPKFMGEKLLANWKNITLSAAAIILLVGVRQCVEHHTKPKAVAEEHTTITTASGVQVPYVTPTPVATQIPVQPKYIDTSTEGLHLPHLFGGLFKAHAKECLGDGVEIATLGVAGSGGDSILLKLKAGMSIYIPGSLPQPGEDTAALLVCDANNPSGCLAPSNPNPVWSSPFITIKNMRPNEYHFACAYDYKPSQSAQDPQASDGPHRYPPA